MIERFSNRFFVTVTWQIAMDGSAEVARSVCWIRSSAPAKRRQLASPGAGRGWLDALHQGVDQQGNAIDVVDPILGRSSGRSTRRIRRRPREGVAGPERIFADDLPQNADFVGAVTAAYQQLCERGARDSVWLRCN
ncbi:mannitol dehydrogenase family protein [Escherichia coli]